jgi:hypothetical protein
LMNIHIFFVNYFTDETSFIYYNFYNVAKCGAWSMHSCVEF